MKMYKAYQFRMYPTNEDKVILNQFLGTSRFIYNYYLNKQENMYKEEHKSLSLQDLKKDLTRLQEEYKWLKMYKIDSYYASSRICSHCGYKEDKVKDLRIREWICPDCGNRNDRDINASINIMMEGIRMYIKEVYSN